MQRRGESPCPPVIGSPRPDEQTPSLNRHHLDTDEETSRYAVTKPLVIDDAVSRRIYWLINRRVLPCMVATYFLQNLDKGALGFASIMGIRTDIDLSTNKYSWLTTIFYFGGKFSGSVCLELLASEYPTNFFLKKFPIAKYLTINVALWSAILICSGAAHSWAALMVLRFFLGVFEACVQPTFIIMTAIWYTRREQTVLISLWFSMTGLQLMVGGLIAYGCTTYIGHSIKNWQLLFIILGCVTFAWAIFLGIYLPDSPMKASCFDENDKRLMVERVRANDTGIQNKKYKRYQVVETLMDPAVLCYVLLQLTSTLVIGGLTSFSNIIINSFGFSILQTQLLNIAQGGVTIIVMISGAALSQISGQTSLIMHIWSIPPLAGTIAIFIVAPTNSTKVGLLIAFYLLQFYLAQGNLIFSLISRNVAGQTKKSLTLTLTFIAWAAGNMVAPQIFRTNDAPRYHRGFIAHFCLYGLFNVILLFTRILLRQRSMSKKARTQLAASNSDASLEAQIKHELAFADLTDLENPEFRYVY